MHKTCMYVRTYVRMYSGTSLNPLNAIDANLSQPCAEAMCEGVKLVDNLFSKGKCRVGGGWVGTKDDCLLVSLRLDPFL